MSEIVEKQTVESPAPLEPGNQLKPFGEALKTLIQTQKTKVNDVAAAIDRSTNTVWTWVAGRRLPTIGQAEALDRLFGSDLVETYRDQLRPDKNQAEALPYTLPVDTRKEVGAIDDFLRGFGPKRGKAAESIAEGELMTATSILPILSRVLDCLELVLRNLSPKSE